MIHIKNSSGNSNRFPKELSEELQELITKNNFFWHSSIIEELAETLKKKKKKLKPHITFNKNLRKISKFKIVAGMSYKNLQQYIKKETKILDKSTSQT